MKVTKMQNYFNGVVRATIRNISIVTLIVFIIILCFSAFGAQLNIDLMSKQFQFFGALLFIACMTLFKMWEDNGIRDGYNEKDYIEILDEYDNIVQGVSTKTLRQFLVYESKNRRALHEDYIIDRTGLTRKEIYDLSIPEIKKRNVKWIFLREVKKLRKTKGWRLAFSNAEQIKGLQNDPTNRRGEMDANARKRHRISGYFARTFYTAVSLFLGLSFTFDLINGNVIEAIIKLLFAIVLLITSIVSGYKLGYEQITIYQKCILRTAVEYIEGCEKFAKEANLPFRVVIERPKIETQEQEKIDIAKIEENVLEKLLKKIDEDEKGENQNGN